MECHDVVENAVARLARELPPALAAELESHLAACPACRARVDDTESVWARLGTDADIPVPVDSDFTRETAAMLEAETLRRRLAVFPRSRFSPALRAAAVLLAGAGGFLLSRATESRKAPSRRGSSGRSKR